MSPGQSWVVVGAVAAGGVLFFAAGMAANRLLRRPCPTAEKLATYESGVDPVGPGLVPDPGALLPVRLPLRALRRRRRLPLPWATVVEEFGAATLVEMFVFLGFLSVGILYAWKRGCCGGP
jgi:NADH-quinone oxidoreductase subunit A